MAHHLEFWFMRKHFLFKKDRKHSWVRNREGWRSQNSAGPLYGVANPQKESRKAFCLNDAFLNLWPRFFYHSKRKPTFLTFNYKVIPSRHELYYAVFSKFFIAMSFLFCGRTVLLHTVLSQTWSFIKVLAHSFICTVLPYLLRLLFIFIRFCFTSYYSLQMSCGNLYGLPHSATFALLPLLSWRSAASKSMEHRLALSTRPW